MLMNNATLSQDPGLNKFYSPVAAAPANCVVRLEQERLFEPRVRSPVRFLAGCRGPARARANRRPDDEVHQRRGPHAAPVLQLSCHRARPGAGRTGTDQRPRARRITTSTSGAGASQRLDETPRTPNRAEGNACPAGNEMQTDDYQGMIAEIIPMKGYNGDVVNAYFSRPIGDGPFGGIVLIHHMPGLGRVLPRVRAPLHPARLHVICPTSTAASATAPPTTWPRKCGRGWRARRQRRRRLRGRDELTARRCRTATARSASSAPARAGATLS